MKKLVAILLCSLMATSAFALLDEDADMMGVYWDMGGDVVCQANPGPGIVTAYLLYTSPTIAQSRGFECKVTLLDQVTATPGMVIWFPAVFPVPGNDLGSNGNMIVGYQAPIATAPATLMATISFFNQIGQDLDVFLGPAEPSSGTLPLPMVMLEDFSLMHVGLSAADGPVAQLGGALCSVVDNEDASFGAVKALFR